MYFKISVITPVAGIHPAPGRPRLGTNFNGVSVSTQTRNLPVLEMGLPFPVLVPLPEVRNPISGTAFTVFFLLFLARVHV